MAVAGFNLGNFRKDLNENRASVQVVSDANTDLPDENTSLPGAPEMALGTMATTGVLKVATSEGQAAVQIYTDWFGPGFGGMDPTDLGWWFPLMTVKLS